MTERCEVNLQWKGIDACFDFYCPCNPEFPQHVDGMFKQQFTCGVPDENDWDDPEWKSMTFCGRTWHLANRAFAAPGPFFHEGNPPSYGCAGCGNAHC